MQLQWMNIKSLIKHNLCDNNCDLYRIAVGLLHSSHSFLLCCITGELFWCCEMDQHYTARKNQTPKTRGFSLEGADACHDFPVVDNFNTNLGNKSKHSPYADISTNSRLQKESIMPVKANKIICLFLAVLSQYLSSLHLHKLSIYLN